MKFSGRDLLWAVIRILVGLIYAYAGLTKLLEPIGNFEATLLRFGVLPPALIPWMAKGLPWVEWIGGVFIVIGYFPRWASRVLCALTLGFLLTLGSSRLFLSSGGADCGCFGTVQMHLSVHQVFVLDLVNFVVLLRMWVWKSFPWSLESFLLGNQNSDVSGS